MTSKKSRAYNRRNTKNKTNKYKKKKVLRRKTIKNNTYTHNKKLLKKRNNPDALQKKHDKQVEKHLFHENMRVLSHLYTNNIV